MAELIGQVMADRYRVDAFLGKGGMAEVYKVWDLHRQANLAMKVLYADLAEDKVFLRRFRREAQTLSKLQHPNIVRFYGIEQDQDWVYLLMDFVDGTNLKKEIFKLQGAMNANRILEVMRPVCSALHYAHSSGFVHCDVKPANIMLHVNGTVYVSDFGIARMTESSTATMVGAGTPAYMAPEQARSETPTPQTDIYSLGIILYEMLTGGERPFTGEHARTTGSTGEKVRWEQVHQKPPSLRKLNPNIAPELEGVVMKCLEKDPGNRFAGVLDLLKALELILVESVTSLRGTITPVIPPSAPVLTDRARMDRVNKPDMVQEPVRSIQKASPNNKKLWLTGLILVSFILIFFLVGYYSFIGIADDSGEVSLIYPNSNINGFLGKSKDSFLFEGSKGSVIKIILKSRLGNAAPIYTILDPNGGIVDAPYGQDEYRLPITGEYQLEISGEGVGYYEIVYFLATATPTIIPSPTATLTNTPTPTETPTPTQTPTNRPTLTPTSAYCLLFITNPYEKANDYYLDNKFLITIPAYSTKSTYVLKGTHSLKICTIGRYSQLICGDTFWYDMYYDTFTLN